MKALKVVIWSLGLLALGCAPTETNGGGTAGNGQSGSAGSTGSAGNSGNGGNGGNSGSTGAGGTSSPGAGGTSSPGAGGTSSPGAGGTSSPGAGGTSSPGAGGTSSPGAGGTSSPGAGGSAGSGTGGAAGTTGRGGSAGSGTGGAAGTTGRGGSAGSGTGGAAGRGGAGGTAGTTGTGGTTGVGGAPVTVSSSCKMPTWPTPKGSTVMISGTKSISGTYDGGGALHEGSLNDCSKGDQSSTTPIMDVADGGTVKNVIFSVHVGDGIHCEGSCTIDNVWFQYVCDDAITMLGGSGKTATITNSGFKGARDKTIQHNGNGSTVTINNVYVETAGKLYRSCGQGCSSSDKRTVNISNVYAIGTDQIAGVSTNDKATLSNICTYRVSTICHTYQPGSDTDATTGANGTGEGPSSACTYKPSDTHALVDHVAAGVLSTDVVCTGKNSAKDGSTNNTACVTGFESCLNGCAPGQYGFKQLSCTGGHYAASGSGCVMSSDATVASNLNGTTHSASATAMETNNNTCTSQWAWGTDGSGKYCVCVFKPGYYQASSSSWWVWDCQSQWW